ncbi:hypothetical protein H6G59_06040 [Anabaena lutea FACHB-196]|uniref:HipA-like kinase domain-containing protein n=1 Tax=Anabaena lutea FACHB-196 TaxID=2692881 RepID=A0ABR8FC17_9NOST|nr:hypothetical protein [Anabaena lutea FACHB-196]
MNNEINIEKDRARWKLSLEELLKNPEEPVLITTLLRGWNSAARPVRAKGIDDCNYVVKGQQAGRQIINDQIVARLGLAMGAPVGEPQIVEISPELLELDPEEKIIQAVARPPDEWRITMDERIAILEFLIKRQQELLESL